MKNKQMYVFFLNYHISVFHEPLGTFSEIMLFIMKYISSFRIAYADTLMPSHNLRVIGQGGIVLN